MKVFTSYRQREQTLPLPIHKPLSWPAIFRLFSLLIVLLITSNSLIQIDTTNNSVGSSDSDTRL